MSARHIRLRAERKVRVLGIRRARARVATNQKRIGVIDKWLKAHPEGPKVPDIVSGFHPGAERNQVQAGGTFVETDHPRLVWHTTEGSSLPTYSGSHPHFTLDFKRRKLYQHIPIGRSAMALKNLPGGVETNRINRNIQVELVGYSDENKAREHKHPEHGVSKWTDSDYAQMAALSRWIEKHAGVPRKTSVVFRGRDDVKRISGTEWATYEGHIGHQHVPEQDHWDPSFMNIKKVLA